MFFMATYMLIIMFLPVKLVSQNECATIDWIWIGSRDIADSADAVATIQSIQSFDRCLPIPVV